MGVLLAGGQSRRMDGQDKALVQIGGQRMIDRVLARLRPQVSAVLLSAGQDYLTGLMALPDRAEGPAGPVGAIRTVAGYLAARGIDGFVTVPVDAPFVPLDLVARLGAAGPVAMARGDGGWQPGFALWSADRVLAALPSQCCSEKWSLRRLGERLAAQAVDFGDTGALMNVNTMQELEHARDLLAAQSQQAATR